MAEPRVIKRYANRKLYDTQRSRYVTLDQIAEMIRGGEDVRIVDNTSKEDLTTITLAQIIFEEEKKQKSFLPLHAMRNIIQSGGERIEELVSQAQKRVTGVFSRKPAGDKAADEAPVVEEAPPEEESVVEESEAGAAGQAAGHRDGALKEFREWIESSQKTIDDWQKKVDERLRHLVEGLSPFATLQKEVASLGTRIAELEKQVRELREK